MNRSWRLMRALCLLVAIYGVYVGLIFGGTQTAFQHFLQASYITWDDFSPEYADALRRSATDSADLQNFDYATLSPLNATTSIPRIMHFIWFKQIYEARPEVTNISVAGSNAPDRCRAWNPSYTVIVWNTTAARDLLEEHYAWFVPTYDAYRHPIQRVDAFKYFVLYHYGGIYSDLDIGCRRPLDPLLRFPSWFPEASPLGVNNDLIGARAGHPILKQMMDTLKERDINLLFPYLTVFWSTGPKFTSDVLKRWFLQRRHEIKQGTVDRTSEDAWYVLPQKFYSEEFSFFGHNPGGTWHGSDVAVVLWFVNHPWVSFLIAASIIGTCTHRILQRRKTQWSQENQLLGNT